MSLYSAFYSGLSGLSTNANALNVVGNNLSNINTVGFKGSSTSFSDIFATSLGGMSTAGNGDPIQFGLGTQVNGVSQDFAQSSFQTASSALDMAIQGNGFFTLETPAGQQVYSRDGSFSINSSGDLVASDGSSVLGWVRDATGNVNTSAAIAPIQISAGTTASAFATKNITIGMNLNASAAADATSAFSTPIQVYDSQGNAQTLNETFTKTAANTWSYTITGPAGATINGVAATTGATGTLVFSASGTLLSVDSGAGPVAADTTAANPVLTISWGNGSAVSTIAANMVTTGGASNISQFSAASAASSSSQDGYGAGSLTSMTVDQNGIISGTFTNGQVIQLAQVALSTFNNVNGLVQAGNNHWAQSLASGSPTVGVANQGGRGGILGSNLELSNVDVATQFTNMILNQRGYEANAKIVTTTDQLLQDTLNMKQ
jgi:flagellar hook protein FlgE